MNLDFNPLEDYVNRIKQNTNFLNRLLTPRISIPLFAIFMMIVGVIAFNG